jgi:hypothetical protein
LEVATEYDLQDLIIYITLCIGFIILEVNVRDKYSGM